MRKPGERKAWTKLPVKLIFVGDFMTERHFIEPMLFTLGF